MDSKLVIDGKEIALSEETVANIKRQLGIVDEVDWLKEGVEYWYIGIYGKVNKGKFRCDSASCIQHKKQGNYYKTCEIAEKKLADMQDDITRKFVKVENYVRNNDDGWVANWNNASNKYYVYFETDTTEWEFSNAWRCQSNHFYMSESMAKKVVEMLNRGDFDEI